MFFLTMMMIMLLEVFVSTIMEIRAFVALMWKLQFFLWLLVMLLFDQRFL